MFCSVPTVKVYATNSSVFVQVGCMPKRNVWGRPRQFCLPKAIQIALQKKMGRLSFSCDWSRSANGVAGRTASPRRAAHPRPRAIATQRRVLLARRLRRAVQDRTATRKTRAPRRRFARDLPRGSVPRTGGAYESPLPSRRARPQKRAPRR